MNNFLFKRRNFPHWRLKNKKLDVITKSNQKWTRKNKNRKQLFSSSTSPWQKQTKDDDVIIYFPHVATLSRKPKTRTVLFSYICPWTVKKLYRKEQTCDARESWIPNRPIFNFHDFSYFSMRFPPSWANFRFRKWANEIVSTTEYFIR